jgi:hypothetical protein
MKWPEWTTPTGLATAVLFLMNACGPTPLMDDSAPIDPEPSRTISESFEMAQAERFLKGNEWQLDVERYARDGSLITTNAGQDFFWMRTQLDQELDAPGTPALCAHLSIRMVYDSNGQIDFPPDSFWRRYNDAMLPHALLDAQGIPMRWPGYEISWALDPTTDPYSTLAQFIAQEWATEFAQPDGRFGVYFDDYPDLYPNMMAELGIEGARYIEMRDAFRAGRTWIVRDLRDRFGDSIVLTVNWAKDEDIRKIDMMDSLDGIGLEGLLTSARKSILDAQYSACVEKGRSCLSTAWNDVIPDDLPYPIVRPGSHWIVRWYEGDEPGSPN